MQVAKRIRFRTRKRRRWRTILQDVVGSTTNDFGILSGYTGSYAIGLNVEQGFVK